ncbi:MAG: amidase, partial [Rhodospirillaceae bacterium]|nr:amidase [Rhodospirillaceae bacterium]
MTELHFETATELVAKIKSKQISALELLEHFLGRVEQYNPALNAIIWMDTDAARARAKAADEALARGEDWGPLHGLPMTVKESFNFVGSPTTFGVPAMKDNIADSNALLVDRLLAAGANIF